MQELSHYEKKLCRLRAQGLSMKEIADLTGKSHGTVRNYFCEIYKKIGRREIDMSLILAAAEVLSNQ